MKEGFAVTNAKPFLRYALFLIFKKKRMPTFKKLASVFLKFVFLQIAHHFLSHPHKPLHGLRPAKPICKILSILCTSSSFTWSAGRRPSLGSHDLWSEYQIVQGKNIFVHAFVAIFS